MQIPRYAPSREFPPYSYVTGMWPHPTSDANGHSFGHEPVKVLLPSRVEWRTCEEYRYGIDLFNHGYYWEAHETWESLWHAAGRKGWDADFFKGLIKLAAAGVKAREGRRDGVSRHLARGSEIIEAVRVGLSGEDSVWGIAIAPLLSQIECWKRLPFDERWTTTTPVLRVWDERLELVNA